MGRARKHGKRTASGRLSRAKRATVQAWDYGTERTAKKWADFGQHGSSAIGRAYAAGLLGQGSDAKARLDAGNRFAATYSQMIVQRAYTCPLGQNSGGSSSEGNPERDQARQDWLFAAMDRLDRTGSRPWLDQILSVQYVDAGPYWLDRVIGRRDKPADKLILAAAVAALDELLSVGG